MNNHLKIWYDKPGKRWFEALPLGNGRLGGMVYGGVEEERIDLSEVTCYSGKVEEGNKNNASAFFPKVKKALLERDFAKAEELSGNITGIRDNYGTNLPLGSINLRFNIPNDDVLEYNRSLAMDKAIASVRFCAHKIEYNREVLASNSDQVLAIRLSASKNNALSFELFFSGGYNPHQVESDECDIILNGYAYEKKHTIEACGVFYCQRARVILTEGSLTNSDGRIKVTGATQAIIFIAINSTFNPQNPSELYNPDFPKKECIKQLNSAQKKGYISIREDHISDFSNIFNRVSFNIECEDRSNLSTYTRLKKVKEGNEDHGLTVLMFQYARYLLISSSRENSPLPAHLQGAWNDNVACRIGWTCDMHLDINTQMNYWPAETANMSECTLPLFKWIEETLVPSGKHSAEKSYSCGGWVAHTVSNPWGFTAPGAATYWGFHPTGGAWIATHMWEHYKYSGDEIFLKEHAYPVIKGAAEFFLEYMFIDTRTGYLVTGPSHSPENQFSVKGGRYTIGVMPTCDIVILNELFDECIEGARILDIDKDFRKKLEEAKKKFPPFQIGKFGQLQEWIEDYEEMQPNHRHTSHLMGVNPFSQITPDKTPELAQAVKNSIKRRMTPKEKWEDTGWARNMLLNYSARLWEGEAAYEHILDIQRLITEDNLFVIHPPTAGADSNVYELDGNTGMCAGIVEMLLQSYDDEIRLLPALPIAWRKGCISGLRARGGYEVDISFKNNELEKAVITGEAHSKATIKYKENKELIELDDRGKYIYIPEHSGTEALK